MLLKCFKVDKKLIAHKHHQIEQRKLQFRRIVEFVVLSFHIDIMHFKLEIDSIKLDNSIQYFYFCYKFSTVLDTGSNKSTITLGTKPINTKKFSQNNIIIPCQIYQIIPLVAVDFRKLLHGFDCCCFR